MAKKLTAPMAAVVAALIGLLGVILTLAIKHGDSSVPGPKPTSPSVDSATITRVVAKDGAPGNPRTSIVSIACTALSPNMILWVFVRTPNGDYYPSNRFIGCPASAEHEVVLGEKGETGPFSIDLLGVGAPLDGGFGALAEASNAVSGAAETSLPKPLFKYPYSRDRDDR